MSYKETKHSFEFGENTIVITENPHYNHIMVKAGLRIDNAVMEDTTYVPENRDGEDAVIIGFPDFNLTICGKHVRDRIVKGLLPLAYHTSKKVSE